MNNKIPLYLIESFIVAAEGPSFQEAAEKLQITQSTLSKQMILFENLLPHQVFCIEGRNKVLTSYGLALYESLRPKFDQTQEIIDQTSLLFSSPKNIEIRISGRGELLDILAINLITEGLVTFLPMGNQDAIESLLNRKADLAILHSAVDSHELVLRPFFQNSFKLAISKKLQKSKIDLENRLNELPCLIYKNEDPVLETAMKSLKIKRDDLKIARIYPNYTGLAKMVDAEKGWAILPSHTEINEERNHIVPISTPSAFNRKFYLCYRKDMSSALWLKNILAEIKKMEIFKF